MMDAKTSIAFDQFQRYQTFARLIDYHREHNDDYFQILELGSNEHKDLGIFLENDEIIYTDIVLTEVMQRDAAFVQADGTNLPFADHSYDFVVAADVFEHVPKDKRYQFLAEAYRVSRKGVILSFPFYSEEVLSAEDRVNTYFKSISGQDFIWLKEHSDNGLPSIAEVENYLADSDYPHFSFCHGNLETWEKMWYCHFNTVFLPETIDFRKKIDQFYNSHIYSSDISESCYRVFYILSHEDCDGWKAFTDKMWDSGTENNISYLDTLLRAHEGIHPLYERGSLLKEVHEKQQHIQNQNVIIEDKERHIQNQNVIIEDKERRIQNQNEIIEDKERYIRNQNDIIEDKERHIQNLDRMMLDKDYWIQSQVQNIESKELQIRNILLLTEEKERHIQSLSQLREELTGKADRLSLQCEQISEELRGREQVIAELKAQQSSLEATFAETDKELAHYKEHYFAAINQREELKRQLADAENRCSGANARIVAMTNSTCWRITKPCRVVMEKIKKILRSNRYTYLCAKGVRSLFRDGVKVTWKKVKAKIKAHNSLFPAGIPLYSKEELEAQKTTVFPRDIKFSILVPLYNTPEKFLREMIRSVQDQTYSNWELCLADGSDAAHAYVGRICKKLARKDKRICYQKLEKNMGISGNTNACIDMATGEFIALFDHDDLLHPSALFEMMKAACEKNADLMYTDENTFQDSPNNAYCPHHKPDFAPDTLRSYNYICHFTAFNRKLLEKIGGGFRSEFDGSQDYDMILRLTEQAEQIVHIPKILYYWRSHANSVASDISAKPYTLDAAKKALAEHLDRIGLKGEILDSSIPSTYKVQYEIRNNPLVSILIPNYEQKSTLEVCLNSIYEKSTYQNFEVIVIENNSKSEEIFAYYEEIQKKWSNLKVVVWDSIFNFSAINNFGAQYASGDYILLLNNDIEIISPDWMEQMLMFAQREDVGAVGAMLYYPDNTVQHAGVILGIGGVAGHSHKYFPRGSYGYMSRMTIAQNFSCVTAACLMMSRVAWDAVGGLDEDFRVAFNDVDLCMRIRKAGYLVVWTPYAEMYHHESKSRGAEDTPEKQQRFMGEVLRFQARWGSELAAGDPYYNPNLSLVFEDFRLK